MMGKKNGYFSSFLTSSPFVLSQ
jgi:hypothetical protein